MTARKTDYTNGSQQRILKVLVALAGQEFGGMTPKDLTIAVGADAPTITRDLDNLLSAGFAELMPDTGRWRLGPKLIQISTAFAIGLDRARGRVAEVTQRYTRLP